MIEEYSEQPSGLLCPEFRREAGAVVRGVAGIAALVRMCVFPDLGEREIDARENQRAGTGSEYLLNVGVEA